MNEHTDHSGLKTQDSALLLAAAELARENAYAPYSHFAVGAAVLGAKGRMYAGCNVENASYGLAMCAERTAIFAAISAGEQKIQSLAVVSSGREPAFPCGACRQVLQEFAVSPDISIVLANTAGQQVRSSLGALLPQPFKMGSE